MVKTCPEIVRKYSEKCDFKIYTNMIRFYSEVLISSPSAAAAFVGGASLKNWDLGVEN